MSDIKQRSSDSSLLYVRVLLIFLLLLQLVLLLYTGTVGITHAYDVYNSQYVYVAHSRQYGQPTPISGLSDVQGKPLCPGS